jgi:hypothetical protein
VGWYREEQTRQQLEAQQRYNEKIRRYLDEQRIEERRQQEERARSMQQQQQRSGH